MDGPKGNALQYETVQVVDPGPVLRDMAFSKDHEQLYIMSERQVRLLSSARHLSCNETLACGSIGTSRGQLQRGDLIYLAQCVSFQSCCLGTRAGSALTGVEHLK